jgi:hypothetical protein
VWLYDLLSRVMEFTFAAKRLERWERRDQVCSEEIRDAISEAEAIRGRNAATRPRCCGGPDARAA